MLSTMKGARLKNLRRPWVRFYDLAALPVLDPI